MPIQILKNVLERKHKREREIVSERERERERERHKDFKKLPVYPNYIDDIYSKK